MEQKQKLDMSEFNDYISVAVDNLRRAKGLTLEAVANHLDVSEQFIKQINSKQHLDHYNLLHLWRLSELFGEKVDKMLPPINDYSEFIKVMPGATKKNYESFLKKYQSPEVNNFGKK